MLGARLVDEGPQLVPASCLLSGASTKPVWPLPGLRDRVDPQGRIDTQGRDAREISNVDTVDAAPPKSEARPLLHGVTVVPARLTSRFGSRSNRCPARRKYVGRRVICRDVLKFIQKRRGDTHGQTQRRLVVRGERLQQFRQVVASRLPNLSQ